MTDVRCRGKVAALQGRVAAATGLSVVYYKDSNSAMAKYGIFADNTSGPGLIADSYASDMGDSSFYIGACPDCNTILTLGPRGGERPGLLGDQLGRPPHPGALGMGPE